MRDWKRNQEQIYYSQYSEGSGKDDLGNTVGSYGAPVFMNISLSTDRGEAVSSVFGKDLDYDREMSTHNMSCPINEYSRLWIGVPSSGPHNYIVKKVAKSRDCIRYAIQKVNVSHAN